MNATSTTAQTSQKILKLTHEQIALCAYLLWEKAGRKPGHDLEYWLQAENQLKALGSGSPSVSTAAVSSSKPASEPAAVSAHPPLRRNHGNHERARVNLGHH